MACAFAAEKVADQTVMIETEDQEMNDAIHKAQASLDDFLKIYAHPPKGASEFRLKVRFKDEGGAEHMWVTPFKQVGAGFSGILADDPEYITSVKPGQEVKFRREDISDWGYVLNGKQKGSFTVCVMFKHIPADEAKKYRKDYGFEC